MKLTPQDWQKLKIPLSVLVVSLITMALFVLLTDDYKTSLEQEAQTGRIQLSQARQKFQTSGQEKLVIVEYLPKYQQLIKDGFIGEERRIEWVDNLRTIHQDKKLFNISYSVGQQEEFKPDFTVNLGTFKLRRSSMKVELSMLHELDLLTLVDALNAVQTTPFILRDCEITRLTAAVSTTLVPNMLAKCQFDWLTVREPENTLAVIK